MSTSMKRKLHKVFMPVLFTVSLEYFLNREPPVWRRFPCCMRHVAAKSESKKCLRLALKFMRGGWCRAACNHGISQVPVWLAATPLLIQVPANVPWRVAQMLESLHPGWRPGGISWLDCWLRPDLALPLWLSREWTNQKISALSCVSVALFFK